MRVFKPVSHWSLMPREWCSTNPSLSHQRSRVFLWFGRERSEVGGLLERVGPPHAESHQRDLTRTHLEGRALLWRLRSELVFVSGLSDYPCVPEEAIPNSGLPESSEDVKTRGGSGLRGRRGSVSSLGRIPSVSCLYTFWMFVSRLSSRQFRYPDQLGLSHYINVCVLTFFSP